MHPLHKTIRMIVSGGQAGVDRAALDYAIAAGIAHGGWCPKGRKAEDGPIPLAYRLTETTSSDYRQRTRANVRDSDATLVLNLGPLAGGTLLTVETARKLDKPCFVAQLDAPDLEQTAAAVARRLLAGRYKVLNVAGPRESKRPGIYRAALAFLEQVDATDRAILHSHRA